MRWRLDSLGVRSFFDTMHNLDTFFFLSPEKRPFERPWRRLDLTFDLACSLFMDSACIGEKECQQLIVRRHRETEFGTRIAFRGDRAVLEVKIEVLKRGKRKLKCFMSDWPTTAKNNLSTGVSQCLVTSPNQVEGRRASKLSISPCTTGYCGARIFWNFSVSI